MISIRILLAKKRYTFEFSIIGANIWQDRGYQCFKYVLQQMPQNLLGIAPGLSLFRRLEGMGKVSEKILTNDSKKRREI